MEKEQKLNEVEAEMKLTMSHAEAMEKLEKERDIYERQTDELHELNEKVGEVNRGLSTSIANIWSIRNKVNMLSSGGLMDDAKKNISAQIAEIVEEQVERISKKGDEQAMRLSKEGEEQAMRLSKENDRVSAPISVVSVICAILLVLLLAFVVLIVVNVYYLHSSWLTKYIWSVIGIGGSYVSLVVYLSYRSRRHSERRTW